MVDTTTQIVGIGGAALASMLLALVIVAFRSGRRTAVRVQADREAAYAGAVADYRATVEQGLRRRGQLVELLEVAFAGRTDRALTTIGAPEIDPAVSRLYLDLALAGDDLQLRETILRLVRRGISDLEMLLPEPPLPPAHAPGLGRRARAAAAQWQASREAELDSLRLLAEHDASPVRVVQPVPVQPTDRPTDRPTVAHELLPALAVAS